MYLVCLDYFAAACCTRKACCSCGSSTKHAAKATKLVYFFIILFAAILSTCFRFISLENSENFLTDKLLFNECEDGGTRCLRTQAILRISWSACLFFIFMIFMVAVKPVKLTQKLYIYALVLSNHSFFLFFFFIVYRKLIWELGFRNCCYGYVCYLSVF